MGISTLAITTDGGPLLVRQSDHNASSPPLLAPSRSGSLEPHDLVESGGGARSTMHDAVRAGMERELCEETGLSPDSVAGTALTGVARWMERSAKPEFSGVTKLSVSSDEARNTASRGVERLYSSDVTAREIDFAAVGGELRGGADVSTPPAFRTWCATSARSRSCSPSAPQR
ncbi:NUDIX hydrolase [Saccharopolyspora pogona]|uniref:hypothetical protein n=1 Tax=Saccharopolyspora pogona TaxID=333966 RepID=UPI001CC2520B|nr:hypothetical protein [Saccharopolyspora pogona]